MDNSIYELQFLYIKKNFGKNISNEEKIKIFNAIKGALSKGATYNQIYNEIMQLDKVDKRYDIIFSRIREDGDRNLLDPNRFYYHSQLRITKEARMRVIDLEDDNLFLDDDNDEDDFFLEMRASYTMTNLIDYIKDKDIFSNCLYNQKKLIGGLTYLIKKYDIDLLLFCIDTAYASLYQDKDNINNILSLADFMPKARENYIRRKTESVINGDNKIIFKKRIL